MLVIEVVKTSVVLWSDSANLPYTNLHYVTLKKEMIFLRLLAQVISFFFLNIQAGFIRSVNSPVYSSVAHENRYCRELKNIMSPIERKTSLILAN